MLQLLLFVFGANCFGVAPIPLDPKKVDPNDWLRQCVPPFKQDGFPTTYINYSNHNLLDMPSGLCADHLSCAFENCEWTDSAKEALFLSDMSTVDLKTIEQYLPPLNLPSSISFPHSPRDVVDALAYAAQRGVSVSIKTSGHSYVGSSTMRDSLMLNLRDFTKYSSVYQCDSGSSNACKLALARGKSAAVRVGGGELWDDLYRAVIAWNKQPGTPSYTVIGGGAGTVSAVGGWLQGGGLSTGLERNYGLGVDQVLEIEMVLADGSHVKFGPTEWEVDDEFIYPRTTKVEGLCNANVVADELQWQWKACGAKQISFDFDDLWFAVRGGGGGTYGVVTAVQIQLHNFQSLYYLQANTTATTALATQCAVSECDISTFENLFYDFAIDLFFNASALGLKDDVSHSCGSPGITFSLTGTVFGTSISGFYCQSEAVTSQVMRAWKAYGSSTILPKLPGLLPTAGDLQNFFVVTEVGSYASQLISSNDGTVVPDGHVPDSPPPATQPANRVAQCWSALVPPEFLLKKDGAAHFFMGKIVEGAHLTGGRAMVAHDQTTAVNPLERRAAFQLCLPGEDIQKTYRKIFLDFAIGDASKTANFPGGTEYNHISADIVGPLKTDWAVPCPLGLTKQEQKSQCVSLVESVWGTELLLRLEKIKKDVDPEGLFNCFRCVGEKDAP